ncbi:MAG: winged helix-turn-helix domain-containing protein [Candidatus Brocadiae bacterium]|nr:winged helix-turn-helix domain-containing protein [Candidatus Brocadiia bacterium]
MKKAEVKVGETYAVKVSGNVVPVVIDEEQPNGGWTGTNQETNRQVRIKSAQRLRCPWDAYLASDTEAFGEDEPDATGRDTGAKGEKKPERKPRGAKAKKRATRAKTGAQERGMSGLDAAAKVLEEADEPLSCKAIVERAFAAGYWQSGGKTPAATIYAAILREMQKKGDNARFRKVERGKFELAE